MQAGQKTHSMAELFTPGKNCWRKSRLAQGAMLIDCANFYRAVHSAIVKARRSIFIVGWDIDSRIQLLRGEDAKKSPYPVIAHDLLKWKAEQNPDIQIYLLRWDSSIVFMDKREIPAGKIWEHDTPPNVHLWLDDTIPAGGSHHQKIIVIDDEVAFTGGMDIARERWDERDHAANDPKRVDLDVAYKPYHDIQIVVSGPVVGHLAALARWRWRHAAGYEALRPPADRCRDKAQPDSWPDKARIYFRDMPCAIARTIPWMGEETAAYEVRRMYGDLINSAERFLYIENQFFASTDIAEVINTKLRVTPGLKVLLVSSCDPQGIFEREAMWSARMDFARIVSDGINPERIQMVFPVVFDEDHESVTKRIHSKVCIVDDSFCTIASSNINNRSMTLDTECDLVLAATTEDHRESIRFLRNDLLAEHTGMTVEAVREALSGDFSLKSLLGDYGRRAALYPINDAAFSYHGVMKPVMRILADPAAPLLPSVYSFNPGEIRPMHNPSLNKLLLAVLVLLTLAGAFALSGQYGEWLKPETIEGFLNQSRGTIWALPCVCLVYLVGGFLLFPVTLLSLGTAAVFGPLWGPLYAMCGALLSASILFGLGHIAGLRGLRRLIGEKARKIESRIAESGVAGMVTVRLVPLAPYSIVNLAAGISAISYRDYIIGTFLGLLPGLVAKGFVGDSLMQLFIKPSPSTYMYVAAGIMFWLLLVVGAQILLKKFAGPKKKSRKIKGSHGRKSHQL